MHAVHPPITPGDTGPAVSNLRTVLLFLLERGALKALEPPNSPTAGDLAALDLKIAAEEAADAPYGGAAQEVAFLLQIRNGLGDGLAGVIEEETARLVNALLAGLQPQDASAGDFVVEGRVVDDEGRGMAGVEVALFEQDLSGAARLGGPVRTGPDGGYRFGFRSEDYLEGDYGIATRRAPPGGTGPAPFMAALLADRPVTTMRIPSGPDLWAGIGAEAADVLARTEIVFNAGPRTRMPDLLLSRAALHAGLSDLERLMGLVSPRLKGVALSGLSEAQADFLARDCEEPLVLVRALVAAARSDERARALAADLGSDWTEAAALLPALQFTVAADRPEAGFDRLLGMPEDDVARALKEGIARNRIPDSIAPLIGDFVPWFADLRARHRLAGKPEDGARPVGPALATLPDGLRPEGEALAGVARALDLRGSDPARFAEALGKAGLDARQSAGVVRTLSLGDLTGGHVPLIGLLQTEDPGPEHAALLDLATLDRKGWTALVEKAGLPAGVEDPAAYVTDLMRGVEQRAPSAHVLARMADGRIPCDDALIEPARAFFAANPDFRFGAESVLARVARKGALDGIDADSAGPLIEELLQVERVTRAAPNLEAAEILLRQGYRSAFDIARRGEEDVVAELTDVLPGGRAEAEATVTKARGIAESAFAVYLALSPQANGEGEVQLLSGSAPQGAALTGAGAQTATLATLFGNQDACACEDCSAMGSPSHYLTELLMLLDGSAPGASPLAVLLGRRPDLAEIELDCDNAGRAMPYIDLVLELLEAPLIEDRLRLPRTVPTASDRGSDPNPALTPQLPQRLVEALGAGAGLDVGSEPTAAARATTPPSWLVKGGGWRFLLTAARAGNADTYKLRLFPQSGRGGLPESWGFPAQMLDAAYAPLAAARHPWSLPFDLAEAETDVWLGMLGSGLRETGEVRAGAAPSHADLAARLALRLSRGEWAILTEPGPAAAEPWRDWGYGAATVAAPSGGSAASLPWHEDLRTVSTLKARAGLTHADLLELVQCRFLQPGQPPLLTITGDECDSDRMRLGDPAGGSAPLDPARLRRIHLFLRLWRRLGWPMRDLDRAIAAFPAAFVATGSQPEAFSPAFLRHLAAVVRLSEQTALDPELALAVFAPRLDTRTYWRQEGVRAVAVPSSYDRLYLDTALNRPRAAAFALNAARDEILRAPSAGEVPALRLGDHVAVIAGALGATAADVLALLPRGEVGIAATDVAGTRVEGSAVDLPPGGDVVIEVVVGTVPANQTATLELRIEQPDATGGFAAVPPADLGLSASQPVVLALPGDGWSIRRFTYRPTGMRAARLRVQATRTQGAAPVPVSARILTAPGRVAADELTLDTLSLLSRHALMARAARLSGAEYARLLDLWGIDPLQAPAGALDFLERLRRSRALGLSAEALDELLAERFASPGAEQRATAQACEALEAVRAALAAEEAELAVEAGQAEATLRKALLEAGWPQRLVDLVVSAAVLDPDIPTKLDAELAALPESAAPLPDGLSFDPEAKRLLWDWPLAESSEALKARAETLIVRLQGDPGLQEVTDALKALILAAEDQNAAAKAAARTQAARLMSLAQSFALPVFEAAIAEASVAAVRAIRIPDAWSDTLWFDAARRRLIFRGPMTAAWRDALKALSSASAFTAAIDALFATAGAFRETAEGMILDPANAGAAYDLLARTPRGMEPRAAVLLARVMPMLRIRRAAQRVAAVMEPRLGLAAPVARALLEQYAAHLPAPLVGQGVAGGVLLEPAFVRSPASLRITPRGFPAQFAALRRLLKLADLARAAGLGQSEVGWLCGPWPGTAAPGPAQSLATLLPTELRPVIDAGLRAAWDRWIAVLTARQRLGGAPGALDGYVRATGAADLRAALRGLADWAGTTPEEMQRLIDGLAGPAATPGALREPSALLHIVDALGWMRRTGCGAANLFAFSAPSLGMAEAERARQFARARVGEAGWAEAARAPLDDLRRRRRDALVAHEIQRLELRDEADLFGRLLADPEMGACMLTTRTRLAISSAQLFVQRIQLGQETAAGLARNAVDPRKWAWMQSYRLWEANLKVLLHSENYLDMSLRRDATPLWKELETDLMQGDISASRASAALATYLDGLDEVARLQTVGLYRETPVRNGWPAFDRQTLHVVGATGTEPRKHFLRQFVRHGADERDGTWTPWRRIDLDLQETFTVSPVARDGEVTLFWLEFREEAEQRLPANSESGEVPRKHWIPSLKWSVLSNGKWAAPQGQVLGFTLQPVPGATERDGKPPHAYSLVRESAASGARVRAVLPAPHVYTDRTEEGGQEVYFETTSIFSKDMLDFDVELRSISIEPMTDVFAEYAGTLDQVISKGINREFPTWRLRSPDQDVLVLKNAKANSIRVARGHQDLPGGLVFRATQPVLFAGLQPVPPCVFAFDAGAGEILAHPRHEDLDIMQFLPGQTFPTHVRIIGGARRLLLSTAHHPHVRDFRRILRSEGLSAFFSLRTQDLPEPRWYADLQPERATIPAANDPKLDVDFRLNGAYAPYNWELFFMVPFAVASELGKQQRFREARDWFHFVFDPTSADASVQDRSRFWNFRPFRGLQGTASIQALVRKLADPADRSDEKRDFLAAIAEWRLNPFDPHLVARFRPVAYQMAVVMAYLRNLIAWGDQLFRRDTMESLNEAAQIYILAAEILGRPREVIPPRTRPVAQSFAELQAAMAGNAGATALSNPLVAAESVLPPDVPGSAGGIPLPRALQFCVPSNPAFEELRQTVQDRLFKLRNCMNIDGVERDLALFEPPIDPAILVSARAAGIDVAALLSETSAPAPHYRFQVLAQKAGEVCADVKSLGAALLAAMEKADAEALARLRSEHELRVLASLRQVKQLQIDEAEAGIRALDPSLEAASRRLQHYVGLLTQVEDLSIPTGAAGPSVGSLLVAAAKTITTVGTVASVVAGATNPVAAAAGVALNEALSRATDALSAALASGEAASAKVPMNAAEKNQLVEMTSAREAQNKANDFRLVAQLLAKIPDFRIGVSGFAASPVSTFELGGSLLSSAANFLATMEDARAAEHGHRATLHGMLAGYQRRAADWMQQALQAQADIEQITRQMASAALRVAIAAQDLRNHDQQMEDAAKVDAFMRSKWSNVELYSWMSQQVSGVYLRSYQLAYDLAKRAERAYQHELGLETSSFVRPGHWDGLKKGLLAGEMLHHDIKRMEAAYLDANARELEITRTISLRQLDAAALMDLRTGGDCAFELPEWLFNMDYPDHWMRRIRSVSVTLPCVVGPYGGVSGMLTLFSGKLRRSPTPSAQGYDHETSFRGSNLSATSVAISTAQGDAGLFEFNLRDERYLPFEGAGLAGSQWRFALPQHLRPFDYETISDLVLTIRYTARASAALRQPAIDHLNAQLDDDAAQAVLIDVRRDFPSVWEQAADLAATAPVTIRLDRLHFPYARARRASLAAAPPCSAWVRVRGAPDRGLVPAAATVAATALADGESWTLEISGLQANPGLAAGRLDELFLSVGYSAGPP